ncbi:MAG TPA: hypothetical protein VIM93_08710 [Kangiella sp.]
MKRPMTTIIQTLVLILILQGCSSMPLSTMLKMSGFDETDFMKLNPEDIRVKVRNNTQENVLSNNILKYQYRGPEGVIDESFSLEMINEDVETVEHWFTDDSFQHSSWYKLDAEGVMIFKRLQQNPLLAMKKKEGKSSFSVKFRFVESTPQQFTISIDLLLSPEGGYFTLLNQHEFNLTEAQNE